MLVSISVLDTVFLPRIVFINRRDSVPKNPRYCSYLTVKVFLFGREGVLFTP